MNLFTCPHCGFSCPNELFGPLPNHTVDVCRSMLRQQRDGARAAISAAPQPPASSPPRSTGPFHYDGGGVRWTDPAEAPTSGDPTASRWYGVWVERDGTPGWWWQIRGTNEDLQTTRTEAERTAKAILESQRDRAEIFGSEKMGALFRYEVRPYVKPAPVEPSPPDDDDPWHAGAIGRIPDDDSLVWRDDATTGPQFYAASPKQAEVAAIILNGLERRLKPSTPQDWRGASNEEATPAAESPLIDDDQRALADCRRILRALVEALPRCECGRPGTRSDGGGLKPWCDECGPRQAFGLYEGPPELPYAVPLRNAQQLLAGAHDAPPPSVGGKDGEK